MPPKPLDPLFEVDRFFVVARRDGLDEAVRWADRTWRIYLSAAGAFQGGLEEQRLTSRDHLGKRKTATIVAVAADKARSVRSSSCG